MKHTAYPLIAAGCLAVTACQDRLPVGPATPSRSPHSTQDVAAAPSEWLTIDHEWARTAREDIPGFAGVYVEDGEKDVTLMLEDTTGLARKVALAEARLNEGSPTRKRVKRVKEATYDFNTLQTWRMAIIGGVAGDEFMGLDIDERANRIAIGVRRGFGRGHIKQQLRRLGVPEAAVTFFDDDGTTTPMMPVCDETHPYYPSCTPPDDGGGGGTQPPPGATPSPAPNTYPLTPGQLVYTPPGGTPATLRDYFPTLVGGAEIGFDLYRQWTEDEIYRTRQWCSMTVGAHFLGREVVVTASHCSRNPGQADATEYYQPANGPAFGEKIWDPAYSLNYLGDNANTFQPCFQDYRCRPSDAAIISTPGRTWTRGHVASTDRIDDTGRSVRVGSVFGFPITGRQTFWNAPQGGPYYTWTANGYSGMPVLKVGRTTGTRNGVVVKTCYDSKQVSRGGASIAYTCQFTVRPGPNGLPFHEPGDSGGPIITDHSGAFWIAGIVSATRRATTEADLYVYTPWANVEQEISHYYKGTNSINVLNPLRQ